MARQGLHHSRRAMLARLAAAAGLPMLAVLPAQGLRAQQASPAPRAAPLASTFSVGRVVRDAAGVETLEDASAVGIGDVIQYTATHHNRSTRRLLEVDFAIAVPPGTSYIADSADPPDGRLLEASGKQPRRMVWRVARIEPDATIHLRMRVRVDPDSSLRPLPAAPHKPSLRR